MTSTPDSAPSITAHKATTAWRLSAHIAFPVHALVLFSFFFAASAPSPMFVVMQRAWHFSPAMLTLAFAVYVVALLSALLVSGSLSDHIGRRPVMVTALVLESLAMSMFLVADGIGGIIAARVVQGIATGIATGAMTAAVVESAPASKKKFGATLSSLSPLLGLAVGALLTGVAISYSDVPGHIVFSTLTVLFLTCAVAVYFTPETVVKRPGVWASLVPRVSVPAKARPDFMRALPAFFAIWAIGGLYLALIPSVLSHHFGIDSGVISGLLIAILCSVGALSPVLFKRLTPAKAAAAGLVSIIVGMLLLIVSLQAVSLPLLFIASATAGLGFGGSFTALMQLLAPQAQPQERAELFAAIFAACYLSFSVPTLIAGFLVKPLGLQTTVEGYALLLIAVSAAGTWALLKARR